jgi:predicted homoserine dehydrogenase-like protein
VNRHMYFSRLTQPVQACLVGAGNFGRSFIAQGLRTPGMDVRVAVDLDSAPVAALFAELGVPAARIRRCESPAQAARAWQEGAWIAAADLSVVLDLPLDIVVEATGHPESGARHAWMAVEADKHVALVSKEVDSVVGPILFELARRRGRTVTPIDGDQPSLLIDLVTWAQVLGFEVLSAGKSSEYDFVFDPAGGALESNGRSATVPAFAPWMSPQAGPLRERIANRSRLAAHLPQHVVPDLCELLVVANATGLVPDVPGLHAPILRIDEVPDAFCPEALGGLLRGTGRLDVFHCLREPDGLSFAGGVFVVVRCDDAPTWEMLRGKGHVLSHNRGSAMLWLPRHLLGLEAATSIMGAVMGEPTGGMAPAHRLDLVAVATAPLAQGTRLDAVGHHHSIADVRGELRPPRPLASGHALPYYLVADRRLRRPVAAGAAIEFDDLELDSDSSMVRLRRMQDEAFLQGPKQA